MHQPGTSVPDVMIRGNGMIFTGNKGEGETFLLKRQLCRSVSSLLALQTNLISLPAQYAMVIMRQRKIIFCKD